MIGATLSLASEAGADWDLHGHVGAVLVATSIAIAPLTVLAVRRVFPSRTVIFARWGFSHLAQVVLLALGLFGLTEFFAPASAGQAGPIAALLRSAGILLAACLLVAVFARRLDPEGLRCLGLWRGRNPSAVLAGLAAYAMSLPGILGLGFLWPWILIETGAGFELPAIARRMLELAPEDRPMAIVLGVAVLPLLEEILFRVFLQPLLVQNLSDKLGIVATSLAFAALHGMDAFLPIFGLSLVLGSVMLRTQRLSAVFAVHALHNGLMFLALFALPPDVGLPPAAAGFSSPDDERILYAMTFFPQKGLFRRLPSGAFAAMNAIVTGDVTLGPDVGIWFSCVVRGDDAPLTIGKRTNVQDLTMIHADTGVPNVIGEEVTIGHRCVLHGARVEDRCLIGMGAVLLGGSSIGTESLVAAGAVVKEGFVVPPRSLVAGVPARILRPLTDAEVATIARSAEGYVRKIRLYLEDGAA